MGQDEGACVANHSTGDLNIQDVASSAEMGTHFIYIINSIRIIESCSFVELSIMTVIYLTRWVDHALTSSDCCLC